MVQKNYKEIATIIKLNLPDREDIDKEIKSFFVEKLASYFEKESKIKSGCCLDCGQLVTDSNHPYHNSDHSIKWYNDFNKQQFLKNCGVN